MRKRFISIKWKLTLSLIASGCLLLLTYIFIAKNIFERDKIAYVFEAQGARLRSIGQGVESHFQYSLLAARAALAFEDPQKTVSAHQTNATKNSEDKDIQDQSDPRRASGGLSPQAEKFIGEVKELLGLEIINEKTNSSVLRFEKSSGVIPVFEASEALAPLGQLQVRSLGLGKFLVFVRYTQNLGSENEIVRLRIITLKLDLLPQADAHQSFLLIREKQIIQGSESGRDFSELLPRLSEGKNQVDETLLWKNGGENFLVSSQRLGLGGLILVALTPESVALGALSTLFIRSVLFLIVSLFLLVLLSLGIARVLTSGLAKLTEVAHRVGKGDFGAVEPLASRDEMEVLSLAMNQMKTEIERLLVETRDKARLDAELKTASLVQEQLMPEFDFFELHNLQVYGHTESASECGGDWWYYFAQGDNLFVVIADATGHGTPAALMTAAARAAFARISEEELTLGQMMKIWDKAIYQCSKGRVCMTGMIVRINSKTGEGVLINASHDAPFLIKATPDDFAASMMSLDASKPIGDNFSDNAPLISFQLEPAESLVLYTDGLFSITREDGKTLSEKRLGRAVAGKARHIHSAQSMTVVFQKMFEQHRGKMPLPDDVTIISIRRQKEVTQ